MKMTAIETIPLSIPIAPARVISSARGTHDRSPFLVVKVHTDDGLIGNGEVSCTPRWSGEDSATASHVIASYIEPRLVGEDPCAVERATKVMQGAIVGHHFTKAAVEMALWDLLGKSLEMPVYRLFGGPVQERIGTKFSVAGVEPERAAEIASWAREQGFRAMKVKVANHGVDADVDRIRAVREAIGTDVWLGVDANGGWTRFEAAEAAARLAELDVKFLEQPLRPNDLDGLAALRQRVSVPVVVDESVGTPEDATAVVRHNAADILSIYVGMAGGLAPARRVAAIAQAAGLGWTIGSNLEMGVGLAAHIHLGASTMGLDDARVPCDILSPFYYDDDILTEPLPIEAGWALPPKGAGLGVELDDEKIARYREDV